jgi:hypothetical protein
LILAEKVDVVAVMMNLIIREPMPRACMKTWLVRPTPPAVHNFVENFVKPTDLEYSGKELGVEIQTEKVKMFH